MRRRLALAVLAAVLASACGEGPRSATMLEESRAELRAEIDSVARRGALGRLRWREEPAVPPARCDTTGGSVDDRASTAGYGLEAELSPGGGGELAEAAAAEWRRLGYRSVTVDRRSRVVTAGRDGMLVELVVDRRAGRAFLGGSTPCVGLRDHG